MSDQAEIDRFIREKGVTKCPPAASAPTTARLPESAQEAIRQHGDALQDRYLAGRAHRADPAARERESRRLQREAGQRAEAARERDAARRVDLKARREAEEARKLAAVAERRAAARRRSEEGRRAKAAARAEVKAAAADVRRRERAAASAAALSDPGPEPRMEWLDTGLLYVDERYQRRIGKDGELAIARIAREWSWRRFQPLTVHGPDESGRYPVIDGQHRLAAARRRWEATQLPCYVIDAPEPAEQARTFVALNRNRINASAIAVFWASLCAGDEEAIRIKDLCSAAGVQIALKGTAYRCPPLTTKAVGALRQLHSRVGPEALRSALRTIAAAKPDLENAFGEGQIAGLAHLWHRIGDRLDRARLVEAVRGLDLARAVAEAGVIRQEQDCDLPGALALRFLRAYNALGAEGAIVDARVA